MAVLHGQHIIMPYTIHIVNIMCQSDFSQLESLSKRNSNYDDALHLSKGTETKLIVVLQYSIHNYTGIPSHHQAYVMDHLHALA